MTKAILVGAGNWGRQLLAASRRTAGLEVVAAVEPHPSEGLDLPVFAALAEAVRSHPAEAVIAATPNTAHLGNAREAAALGLHLFVEKPIARTSEEGREMVRLMEAAGKVLMVGHNGRRMAGHRWLKELLLAGELGQVVSAEAFFSHAGVFDIAADAWRNDPDACPAVGLTQLGVHFADTLLFLLGPAAEVKALFASVAGQGGVEDSTHALVRFESGAISTLCSNYSTAYDYRIKLHGTKALAEVRFGRHASFQRLGGPVEALELEEKDTLAEELEEFARCCHGEGLPETGGAEGLAAWAIVEEAIRQAPRPGVLLSQAKSKDPLASFLDSRGRLTAWPALKKRPLQILALHRLAGLVEEGRTYTEPEVNETLKKAHTFGDWALLRRELVDLGLLGRKDDLSAYWRTDKPLEPGV